MFARLRFNRTPMGGPGAWPPGLLLRADEVAVGYAGKPVLHGVALDIRDGEAIAIVGASGCGKSTLKMHLIGAGQPLAGRVLARTNGREPASPVDVAESFPPDWGVVFQSNALLTSCDTVYDNFAVPLRERATREGRPATDEAVAGAVRETVLPLLADLGLPATDAFLSQPPNALSVGQQKRVALARTWSLAPSVVFYDEPTAGLDPETEARVQQLIVRWHREPHTDGAPRTTIVVTHDQGLLACLRPRVVMLADARVHFDGSYPEFQTSRDPRIRAYRDPQPPVPPPPVAIRVRGRVAFRIPPEPAPARAVAE